MHRVPAPHTTPPARIRRVVGCARGLPSAFAAVACAALLAATPCTQAATQVGPASFTASAALEVDRGALYPAVYVGGSSSTWNGQGAAGASYQINAVPWFASQPSDADATATDTALHAYAVSTGAVFSNAVVAPHVYAYAKAQTTRMWAFGSDFTVDDVPLLFDGVLAANVTYAEVPKDLFSRVRYSFTVTDEQGHELALLARLEATSRYLPGSNQIQLLRSTGGYADPAVWAGSFTALAPPFGTSGPAQYWAIGHLEDLDTAFVARAGHTYGFRWTLEAETSIAGEAGPVEVE